jgi:hypothetical protein
VELRETGEWLSPVRRAWGLEGEQPLTPELEQRICFTAAATFSYQRAAEVAACWGSPLADDSTIWHHVQKAGARATEAEQQRVREMQVPLLREKAVGKAARENGKDFSLVIMMDGWMARERGEDWGRKPLEAKGDRVAWREQKTAIILRTDHRATTQSGRHMVVEKAVVCHQGEWDGLAKKLHAEALRRGAATAREVFIVADGGLWIWNLVAERFPHSTQTLDFYHASQHLWAVARALHGEGAPAARQWIEPLLHQLRHGGEAGVLTTLDDLSGMMADLKQHEREEVTRGQNYFKQHKDRLHYQAVENRGCPVGSGAMESTCSQLQGRMKRTGQFWTPPGKTHLLALQTAHLNRDWAALWPQSREQD